jgi:hypothetical protein
MKKLIVLSILAAFACVTAVQAGENCCDKSKASTCSDSKTSCCSSAKKVTKKVDTSVKGASQLLVRK